MNSVWRCVAVCVTVCGGVWKYVAVCGGVWQCVAACGGVWSPEAEEGAVVDAEFNAVQSALADQHGIRRI